MREKDHCPKKFIFNIIPPRTLLLAILRTNVLQIRLLLRRKQRRPFVLNLGTYVTLVVVSLFSLLSPLSNSISQASNWDFTFPFFASHSHICSWKLLCFFVTLLSYLSKPEVFPCIYAVEVIAFRMRVKGDPLYRDNLEPLMGCIFASVHGIIARHRLSVGDFAFNVRKSLLFFRSQ